MDDEEVFIQDPETTAKKVKDKLKKSVYEGQTLSFEDENALTDLVQWNLPLGQGVGSAMNFAYNNGLTYSGPTPATTSPDGKCYGTGYGDKLHVASNSLVTDVLGQAGQVPLAKVTMPESLKDRFKNVQVAAPLASTYEKVFEDIDKAGLSSELKTFDGTYNYRNIAGTNILSHHSWGMPIDINAATNARGVRGDMHPGIVAAFKKQGFTWGGDWSNPDPMHFEPSKELLERMKTGKSLSDPYVTATKNTTTPTSDPAPVPALAPTVPGTNLGSDKGALIPNYMLEGGRDISPADIDKILIAKHSWLFKAEMSDKSRFSDWLVNLGKENNVNPVYLLALLEKEQGLVSNYKANALYKATGFGHPDGGGHNPKYEGFESQLRGSAKSLGAGGRYDKNFLGGKLRTQDLLSISTSESKKGIPGKYTPKNSAEAKTLTYTPHMWALVDQSRFLHEYYTLMQKNPTPMPPIKDELERVPQTGTNAEAQHAAAIQDEKKATASGVDKAMGQDPNTSTIKNNHVNKADIAKQELKLAEQRTQADNDVMYMAQQLKMIYIRAISPINIATSTSMGYYADLISSFSPEFKARCQIPQTPFWG